MCVRFDWKMPSYSTFSEVDFDKVVFMRIRYKLYDVPGCLPHIGDHRVKVRPRMWSNWFNLLKPNINPADSRLGGQNAVFATV